MPPAPAAPKAHWRRWARAVWSTLDLERIGPDVCAGLVRHRLSGLVVIYLAMEDEVDLRPLLRDDSVDWAATRTPPEGPLTVHRLGEGLERHAYGFEQPAPSATPVALEEIDTILVPGLVFDRHGGRLGRGRGYYDGLIGRLGPGTKLIGVVPDTLVVERLPMDDHDQAVGWLATERGVVQVDGTSRR